MVEALNGSLNVSAPIPRPLLGPRLGRTHPGRGVMRGLDDLVRAGKVPLRRYFDAPACGFPAPIPSQTARWTPFVGCKSNTTSSNAHRNANSSHGRCASASVYRLVAARQRLLSGKYAAVQRRASAVEDALVSKTFGAQPGHSNAVAKSQREAGKSPPRSPSTGSRQTRVIDNRRPEIFAVRGQYGAASIGH